MATLAMKPGDVFRHVERLAIAAQTIAAQTYCVGADPHEHPPLLIIIDPLSGAVDTSNLNKQTHVVFKMSLHFFEQIDSSFGPNEI